MTLGEMRDALMPISDDAEVMISDLGVLLPLGVIALSKDGKVILDISVGHTEKESRQHGPVLWRDA